MFACPKNLPTPSPTPSWSGVSLWQARVRFESMAISLRLTRRFGLVACLVFVALEAVKSRLDVINLPVGFFPEGITRGDDEWTAYVGSLAGDGPVGVKRTERVLIQGQRLILMRTLTIDRTFTPDHDKSRADTPPHGRSCVVSLTLLPSTSR